jgi:hypothetical protein
MMNHSVRLNSSIPLELVDEFLKRLPYVSESLSTYDLNPQTRDTVTFELVSENSDQPEVVSTRIVEIADKLCKGHRAAELKVLVSREGHNSSSSDPHPELEARGELRKYGEGRFGFGPRLVQLMELFDRELREMAARMSAVPHQFPALIGADTLDRCRYLQSFPSTLTMVSHLREDLGAIQNFARSAGWDRDRLTCAPDSLSAIQCLLAPAVCFHYYEWLRNRSIAPSCVTAVGKCFRYESKNMAGLERLWDFTMREVIFAGSARYALSQRERAIEEAVGLLDRWGLSYEIKSATDPFFIEDYAAMTAFQLAFDLKFEVLAPLPYRQKDLAIGSFNYHQDFFGRSFSISDENGMPTHTACVAFGLERLALAFLAQHGVSSKRWPQAITKELSP